LVIALHAWNPSICEAGTEGSWAKGQLRLHTEPSSQKEKQRKKLNKWKMHQIFLLDDLKCKETQTKIDKWEHMKLKTCTAKETLYKMSRQCTNERKYLQGIHD
jgi:hypothetical protein